MEALIAKAIENRRALIISHSGFTRKVCAHLLGETADGRTVIHAFQYGGKSSKGDITLKNASWRFFYINDIEALAASPTNEWYPLDLAKNEEEYVPPAFVAKVVALAGR